MPKKYRMKSEDAAHFNAEKAYKGEKPRYVNAATNRVEGAPGGAEEPDSAMVETRASRPVRKSRKGK